MNRLALALALAGCSSGASPGPADAVAPVDAGPTDATVAEAPDAAPSDAAASEPFDVGPILCFADTGASYLVSEDAAVAQACADSGEPGTACCPCAPDPRYSCALSDAGELLDAWAGAPGARGDVAWVCWMPSDAPRACAPIGFDWQIQPYFCCPP